MIERNSGICCICEGPSTFAIHGAWLRDQYVCDGCGTIPRARAVVEVLNHVAPNWKSGVIHESSPSMDYFARKCPGYSYSFYFSDVPPGHVRDGNRCENLEAMTFPADSFDVFITQDVLEHVFRPGAALSEIMRVVRPGGVHIFTTPKHRNLLHSRQRAALTDTGVFHILPPEFHGNPIDSQGSLVTWDYGVDLDERLQGWSGYRTSTYLIRDRHRGIDGEFLDVFVTRKDAVNRHSL